MNSLPCQGIVSSLWVYQVVRCGCTVMLRKKKKENFCRIILLIPGLCFMAGEIVVVYNSRLTQLWMKHLGGLRVLVWKTWEKSSSFHLGIPSVALSVCWHLTPDSQLEQSGQLSPGVGKWKLMSLITATGCPNRVTVIVLVPDWYWTSIRCALGISEMLICCKVLISSIVGHTQQCLGLPPHFALRSHTWLGGPYRVLGMELSLRAEHNASALWAALWLGPWTSEFGFFLERSPAVQRLSKVHVILQCHAFC